MMRSDDAGRAVPTIDRVALATIENARRFSASADEPGMNPRGRHQPDADRAAKSCA